MADPFNIERYFAPKRVVIEPKPLTPESTVRADPNALMALADLLKRTQMRRVDEQRPGTPDASVSLPSPPDVTMPPFQVPPQPMNQAGLAGPQALGAAQPPGPDIALLQKILMGSPVGSAVGSAIGGQIGAPPTPPVTVRASPQTTLLPGPVDPTGAVPFDQPPGPPPQVLNFWQRLLANKAGLPTRGAMGEEIPNA